MGGTVSKLNRRFSAALISDTPRSRRFAVAITLKPSSAFSTWGSLPESSGTASRRSLRIDTSASCTSGRQRVTSSMRASEPRRIAVSTGDGTMASGCGPFARRRA
jgi:hypothetical protein